MKHLFSLFISFFLCVTLADADVRLVISDGLDNAAVVKKIEQKASALLTEINEAQSTNRIPKLKSLRLDQSVQASILMLWDNSPFYITDQMIVEKCVITKNGYQVRNIPILMTPKDPESYIDEEYQEGVINFTRSGEIESFHLSGKTLQSLRACGIRTVRDLYRQGLAEEPGWFAVRELFDRISESSGR